MAATGDKDPQRRDQWGGALQNEYGMAIAQIASTVNELHRGMGRLEEGVDQLRTSADSRDGKLQDLTDRVRQNAHTAANVAQKQSLQIETLQTTSKRTEAKVDGLNTRVSALEKPVKQAVLARMRRRKMWIQIVSVSASIGIAAWAVAEPIWRAIAPSMVQRWFSDGPPH